MKPPSLGTALHDILAKIQTLQTRFGEAQMYGIPEPLLWGALPGPIPPA